MQFVVVFPAGGLDVLSAKQYQAPWILALLQAAFTKPVLSIESCVMSPVHVTPPSPVLLPPAPPPPPVVLLLPPPPVVLLLPPPPVVLLLPPPPVLPPLPPAPSPVLMGWAQADARNAAASQASGTRVMGPAPSAARAAKKRGRARQISGMSGVIP
jgi:hypothetical protein